MAARSPPDDTCRAGGDGRLRLRQEHDRRHARAPAAMDLRGRRLVSSRNRISRKCTMASRSTTRIAGRGCTPSPTGSTPRARPASTASSPARRSSAPIAISLIGERPDVRLVYLKGDRDLIAQPHRRPRRSFHAAANCSTASSSAGGAAGRRAADHGVDRAASARNRRDDHQETRHVENAAAARATSP